MFLSNHFLLLSPFQMMGFIGKPILTDSTSTSGTKPLSVQLPTGWIRWYISGWYSDHQELTCQMWLLANSQSQRTRVNSEFQFTFQTDQQWDWADHAPDEWDYYSLQCPLHTATLFQWGEFYVLVLVFWQTLGYYNIIITHRALKEFLLSEVGWGLSSGGRYWNNRSLRIQPLKIFKPFS